MSLVGWLVGAGLGRLSALARRVPSQGSGVSHGEPWKGQGVPLDP